MEQKIRIAILYIQFSNFTIQIENFWKAQLLSFYILKCCAYHCWTLNEFIKSSSQKQPGGIGRIKAKVNSNVAAVKMVEMSHLLKDTLKVYNNLSPNINSIDNDIPNTIFWPL